MVKTKKTSVKLIKATAFMLIVLVIFTMLSEILNVDPQGDYDLKDDYFYTELDKDYAEVIFFGASQTGRAVSPTTIFNETGYSSYVYSTAGMPIFTYYHKIKDLIDDGFKPKLVVLDISSIKEEYYFNDPIENEDRFRTGYYVMQNFDNKIDYALEMEEHFEGNFFFSYLFPIFSYHEAWKEGTANVGAVGIGNEEFKYWGMGANLSDKILEVKPIEESYINEENQEMAELDSVAEEYFVKTAQLLKENDIELLAIKHLDSVTDSETHNSLQALCDENNVEFLNLNLDQHKNSLKDQYGLSYDIHFYNYKHNNAGGMEIVSKYIADYLEKEYTLTDYSEDEEYQFMFDYHDKFQEVYLDEFDEGNI